jgi:hypothetical protein
MAERPFLSRNERRERLLFFWHFGPERLLQCGRSPCVDLHER